VRYMAAMVAIGKDYGEKTTLIEKPFHGVSPANAVYIVRHCVRINELISLSCGGHMGKKNGMRSILFSALYNELGTTTEEMYAAFMALRLGLLNYDTITDNMCEEIKVALDHWVRE
jgi:hypothetical protein